MSWLHHPGGTRYHVEVKVSRTPQRVGLQINKVDGMQTQQLTFALKRERKILRDELNALSILLQSNSVKKKALA